MCFFGGSFFKIKIADILNFKWIKYLGKDLSYLTNGGIEVNSCWNYGPSKLLLHFIEYCLDQLNNKHTKTPVNSTMQFFESYNQKKYMVKLWSFLAHPPHYDDPVKFLRNWTKSKSFNGRYFQTSRTSDIGHQTSDIRHQITPFWGG